MTRKQIYNCARYIISEYWYEKGIWLSQKEARRLAIERLEEIERETKYWY